MGNDMLKLAVSLVGVVVGLVVMLFGVFQTAGQSANGPMWAGGIILLGAVTVLSVWGMQGDGEGSTGAH